MNTNSPETGWLATLFANEFSDRDLGVNYTTLASQLEVLFPALSHGSKIHRSHLFLGLFCFGIGRTAKSTRAKVPHMSERRTILAGSGRTSMPRRPAKTRVMISTQDVTSLRLVLPTTSLSVEVLAIHRVLPFHGNRKSPTTL
jgi:hypothetical protein